MLTSEIAPQPVRVGSVSITLGLYDAATKPVAGAHITLEGDMSHPGMAPVFGETNEIAPGHYQGRLQFVMPGDWVVLVHARLANGKRLERQIEVRGVQAK
jgi:YtkA-like